MMKRPGRERGRERVQIRPKPQRVAFRAQSANRASFHSSDANRIRILASIPLFVRRSFLSRTLHELRGAFNPSPCTRSTLPEFVPWTFFDGLDAFAFALSFQWYLMRHCY